MGPIGLVDVGCGSMQQCCDKTARTPVSVDRDAEGITLGGVVRSGVQWLLWKYKTNQPRISMTIMSTKNNNQSIERLHDYLTNYQMMQQIIILVAQ